MRVVALVLAGYGAALVCLQTEVPLKLVRGAMGYAGWVWGGMSSLPGAWSGPTGIDEPMRAVYSALTLRMPLLPWIALVAGSLVLLGQSTGSRQQNDEGEPGEAVVTEAPLRARRPGLALVVSLVGLAVAVLLAAVLRGSNLLPAPDGTWTGSNFDEMVYLSDAALFLRGGMPYRDVFMAHPPGVVVAFAAALLAEKPWGGAAAFVAARQWLLAYSLLAVPLAWLAAARLGGAGSAAVASLVMALDGKAAFAPQSDRQLPNVGVLETLVNLTGLGALAVYLYAPGRWAARRWWMLGVGALCGVSAACKLPGIALLAALVVYALARRQWRESAWLAGGGIAGAAAVVLPFLVQAPGQIVRQALFFQLLRPQEVREGVDQAARIATYPEAQLTMLLAGLGIIAAAVVLARTGPGREWHRWALPVLWAAPIIAVFAVSRSYHSQYYTQWVPPLALVAACLASRQVWERPAAWKWVAAALVIVLAFPLSVSQWNAAARPTLDQVYAPVGRALLSSVRPGEQAMAFDPGYTFAAGLPPARVPLPGGNGDYIVDTAGYTIYLAEEMDRAPWGDLLRRTAADRERNELEVLQRPEAQAALLAGALGAGELVLDHKIALPKLTAQSTRLLEGRATSQEEIAFATLLHMRPETEAPMPPFKVALAASTLLRAGDLQAPPQAGNLIVRPQDTLQVALYWRPVDYPGANLRVVVRLVGRGGDHAGQVDTEPSEGSRHTADWRPGLVYPDIRNFPPGKLQPGEYRVLVRLYDPASGVSSPEVQLP